MNTATLQRLLLRRNFLDFADLEPLNLSVVEYSPQNRQQGNENRLIPIDEAVTLLANIEGSQNQYQWFKDGQRIFLQPQQNEAYLIEAMSLADAGEYECLVTSNLVPDLTLRTRFITLSADCGEALQAELVAKGTTSFCANENVFVTMETPALEDVSYQWFKNDTLLTLATDRVYNAFTAGSYQLQITAASGCTAVSQAIEVKQSAGIPISVTLTEDNRLQATTGGEAEAVYWLLNGTETGATGSELIPEEGGVYQAAIANAQGCVSVSQPQLVSAVTSLDEELETGLVVLFPNPTRDRLTIAFPEKQRDVMLTLRQTDGKQAAYYHHQNVESVLLNLEGLPSGVYLLEISSEQGHVLKRIEKL